MYTPTKLVICTNIRVIHAGGRALLRASCQRRHEKARENIISRIFLFFSTKLCTHTHAFSLSHTHMYMHIYTRPSYLYSFLMPLLSFSLSLESQRLVRNAQVSSTLRIYTWVIGEKRCELRTDARTHTHTRTRSC